MYVDSLGNRWYKGNLHTHTTASDGKLSYEEAVARYRQAGYDFLAVSDHWVPSQTVEEPDFLLISGVEYDANFETDYHGHSHKVCVHLNGVGFTAQPAVTRGQTPQEMVDAIHAAGGIVTFNHPEWSRNTAEDIWVLHGLDGVEIYNHGCSWESKSGYSGVHVDLLALGGRMLPVMAADDAHRYVGDECGGFLWLAAESLSHADVLDALSHDAAQLQAQSKALQTAQAALALTQDSYQAGQASLLQLLESQRLYQQARLGYARVKGQRYSDTAQLFIALGGSNQLRID